MRATLEQLLEQPICLRRVAADPMACEAEGPGIQGTASRQAVSAGEEATLVITAKDSKGRPIGGGNDVFKGWLARVARDDETVSRKRKEAVVMANVVDNGDGTYTMSYVPHVRGYGAGMAGLHVGRWL